jgi:hypothetical protein
MFTRPSHFQLLVAALFLIGLSLCVFGFYGSGLLTKNSPGVVSEAKHRRHPESEGKIAQARGQEMASEVLARAFRFLRGRPESMPRELGSQVAQQLGIRPRTLNLAAAQFIWAEGQRLWLVGGGGGICLVQASGGAVACDLAARVAHRGLALGVFDAPSKANARPHNFQLLGIAPDWARFVRLSVAGVPRSTPVRHGVYLFRANAPISVKKLEG